ncbi:serine hydrolase domain-containing protein [Herbiconiux sp. 11R-BC]|uniref:serine hydrolase domain-containing protein n=1 Tax=Herbiconiux sp. 11R-BC TaxID=3111637 RepID=UPI003C08D40B
MTRIHPRARRGLAAAAAAAAAVAFAALATTASPAAGADRDARVVTMTPELTAKIQHHIETFRAKYDISGMSMAVVTPDPDDPGGPTPVVTTFAVGTPNVGSPTPVDASTQFEIASETKIFTSDLLAHLVASGTVALDDPVQKYAPAGIAVPVWTDPQSGETTRITLRDLATHQAGLPDMPGNFEAGCGGDPDCVNPHPGYTQTMLWDALAAQSLLWKPGTDWLYSNWGFGLLGTILSDVVDPSVPIDEPPAFQPALESTFLDALGMSSTMLGTGPSIATPYTSGNTPTYYWEDVNALAGEGGLVSDATDMGAFVAAHLGYLSDTAPPGVRTMADTLEPVSAITTECFTPTQCQPSAFHMGLGWQLYPASASNMGVDWAFKNGGTAGFSSDTTLAPSKGVGVTTMWNQNRVDDAEPAIELLTLILAETPDAGLGHDAGHDRGHSEGDSARLADTGSSAFSLTGAAVGAAILLGAGVVLRTRRREADDADE